MSRVPAPNTGTQDKGSAPAIPTNHNNLRTTCALCALCLGFIPSRFSEIASRRVHAVPNSCFDGMYLLCLMIINDQPAILSLSLWFSEGFTPQTSHAFTGVSHDCKAARVLYRRCRIHIRTTIQCLLAASLQHRYMCTPAYAERSHYV